MNDLAIRAFSYLAVLKIHKMKKFGIIVLSALIGFSACRKDESPGTTVDTYPTSGLKVDSVQRVTIMEHTGTWCQWCPNGAQTLIELVGIYGDDVLPMAIHDGDPLASPIAGVLKNNFPPAGYPAFYVGNDTAEQNPANFISKYLGAAPVFGVAHAIQVDGDSIRVYPKVEVFQTTTDEDYLINSYLLLDAVVAKDWGNGIDLNQTTNTQVNATGSNPTTWIADAAVVNGEPLIKAGTPYEHQHAVVDANNGANPWGKALADANPFGRHYIAGDILGSKNTSIELVIPHYDASQFNTGLSVVTIIWRLKTDGSGTYEFVNGYLSEVQED